MGQNRGMGHVEINAKDEAPLCFKNINPTCCMRTSQKHVEIFIKTGTSGLHIQIFHFYLLFSLLSCLPLASGTVEG